MKRNSLKIITKKEITKWSESFVRKKWCVFVYLIAPIFTCIRKRRNSASFIIVLVFVFSVLIRSLDVWSLDVCGFVS